MPKITQYRLLKALSSTDLNTEVSNYIRMGYQPYGSPFHTQCGEVCQAVVAYERVA